MAKQQTHTGASASSKTKSNTKAARQEKAINDVIAHGWRIGKITSKAEEDDVRRVMRNAVETPAQRYKRVHDEVMRKSQERDKKRRDMINRAVAQLERSTEDAMTALQVRLGTYMPPDRPENNDTKPNDVINAKLKQGVLL